MFANIEYEVDELRRDLQVLSISKEKGIRPHYFHDRCIIEPGVIKTKDGRAHAVCVHLSRHVTILNFVSVGLLSLPENLDREAQREDHYISCRVSSPGSQCKLCPHRPCLWQIVRYASASLRRGI